MNDTPEIVDDDPPSLEPDQDDIVLSVETDEDGNVDIMVGQPDEGDADQDEDASFDENLALRIDEDELSRLGGELIRLIDLDDESRQEWLESRAEGIKLLGITIEKPSENDKLKGMSRVRHPLLLEACLRFQANARGELLPVDGPVKVRVDGAQQRWAALTPSNLSRDDLAEALESDMNHYLTTTATEFYPSTDKMLFSVGFSGMGFKKVFHCPLRRRPVSEAVDAGDVIASNDIEDIRNASRVTHRIKMRSATMRRMQLAGAYRDIVLADPQFETENVYEAQLNETNGISSITLNSEEEERTVLECYCELDLFGYEHEEDGVMTGLPLPYKVVIDKSSKHILEIRRNYRDNDPLYTARQALVPFEFVPWQGGFYALGLLSIVGNSAMAATAGWRMLFDAGAMNITPSGFVDKSFMRQNTVDIRLGPGQWMPIETGGKPVSTAFSAFPFRPIDPAFMALIENVVETGQRIGGVAEIQVGEGKQNAPVGTTVALLEQSTIPMDAVHKRLCRSMQREFELLGELFQEDPESFWRGNRNPATQWDKDTLVTALNTYGLVPVADPNTSSHMQRVMAGQALWQMATEAPPYFDGAEVIQHNLELLRISNPERFIAPNHPPPGFSPPPKGGAGGGAPPDPVKSQAMQATAQANIMRAQAVQKDADTKAQAAQGNLSLGAAKLHADTRDPTKVLGAQADMMDAQTNRVDAANKAKQAQVDQQNNMMDAQSQAEDQRIETAKLALEAHKHVSSLADNQADRDADLESTKIAAKAAAKGKPKP